MSGTNRETLLITAMNVYDLFELSQTHKYVQGAFVAHKIIETRK